MILGHVGETRKQVASGEFYELDIQIWGKCVRIFELSSLTEVTTI